MLRTDAMAHRICFREPQDATKEGLQISGSVGGIPLEADPAAQDLWADWMDARGILGQVVLARGLAKAHGGAAWVVMVDDGRRTDQPIDWTQIRRVPWVRTLRGGRSSLVQPQEYDRDPLSPRFDQPRTYNVSFPSGGSGIFHWSRVILWQGDVTDPEDLVSSQGWGESVLDRVWTALRNFGASHQYGVAALLKMSQGVLKSRYLAEAIEAGNAAAAERKLESVALGMGVFGEMAIGEEESYQIMGRQVSGVDGLLAAFGHALVAATDMPEIVLMGRRPGGLSAAADGEFRGWYDYVASQQPVHYTPHLVRLVDIASRSLAGPTGGIPVLEPGIVWPKLWQLTEAEVQANRKAAADARAVDVNALIVTAAEARTDPDLGEWYTLSQAAAVPPEEEMAAASPEIQVENTDELADGDVLISLKEAAGVLGYRSSKPAMNFAMANRALFRPGAPGTAYRVSRQRLTAAMASSIVEPPSEG
jgi:phage-related protein (TIGR01555 family)